MTDEEVTREVARVLEEIGIQQRRVQEALSCTPDGSSDKEWLISQRRVLEDLRAKHLEGFVTWQDGRRGRWVIELAIEIWDDSVLPWIL